MPRNCWTRTREASRGAPSKAWWNTAICRAGQTKRQARVVYKRSDLQAILDGIAGAPASDPVTKRPADTAVAIVRSTEAQVERQIAVGTAQADFFAGLAAHLAKLSGAYPTPAITKAWLTLAEAVEYSGLPSAELQRLLREGWVHSIGRGPKTWRVQRASLDAHGQAAHQ